MASGKKKKKNAVTLISLTAVLAALILVYIAASRWKTAQEEKEEEGSEEDTSVSIAAFETKEIAAISVESDLYNYALQSEEAGWEMAGDTEFPLDTTRPDKMAAVLEDFTATRLVMENAPDLSEYGLAEPLLKVTVTMEDGTDTAIWVGDQSSADGGYYTCIGGSSDVYLISAGSRSVFYLEEEELVLEDSIPSFTSGEAAGLKVTSETWPEFTITDTPEDEIDLTARNLYPLSLYGVYAIPVHVDQTGFAELMENYTAIDLGELVSWHKAELESYGLAAPKTALTVWYTDSDTAEEGEFTLYFGSMTEDGSACYVRLEGSSQVFEMDAETAEGLLEADTFSVISKYPQMVNITLLGGMHVSYKDTVREFAISHTTETSGDAVTITDYFTVDGKELDMDEESDAFRDIYQLLIAIKLTGGLDSELTVLDEPVLTLEFLADETLETLLTVRYLPIEGDAGSYAIEVNGTLVFTADAAAVDEVIASLEEYQP